MLNGNASDLGDSTQDTVLKRRSDMLGVLARDLYQYRVDMFAITTLIYSGWLYASNSNAYKKKQQDSGGALGDLEIKDPEIMTCSSKTLVRMACLTRDCSVQTSVVGYSSSRPEWSRANAAGRWSFLPTVASSRGKRTTRASSPTVLSASARVRWVMFV